MIRSITLALCVLAFTSVSMAKVQTKAVSYKDGDTQLEGYMAWDDAISGKRPGVMVVHEWWGLNDYPKMRARMLAELGYVAFAADIYGKGKIAANPKEAGAWSGHMKGDINEWRHRAELGLEQLKADEHCDTARLGAIGYCFGGSTVMQMAIAGMDLKGVVSFHGAPPSVTADDFKKCKAKILICHGGADAFVPMKNVDSFTAAAGQAKVDWRVTTYANATHSWTNPEADGFASKFNMPVKYNPEADKASWEDMKTFFAQTLK